MEPRALQPLPSNFPATVASLHRVAEALLGPACKSVGALALVATPNGFGTPEFESGGGRQHVRVEGSELVREVDGREVRAPLRTLAVAGAIVSDLLAPAAELSDEPLEVDGSASLQLGSIYAFGADVLAALAGQADPEDSATPPRLWPEHFDIAIELGSEARGSRANYGLSPGDEGHREPYLYVGPWNATVSGEAWNARGFTGAELGYGELIESADPGAVAREFFMTRRDLLSGNGGSGG